MAKISLLRRTRKCFGNCFKTLHNLYILPAIQATTDKKIYRDREGKAFKSKAFDESDRGGDFFLRWLFRQSLGLAHLHHHLHPFVGQRTIKLSIGISTKS